MPVCVIHIGVHRTGTSAFQHVLGHGRERLARAGILVPSAQDRRITGSHHGLSFDLGIVDSQLGARFGLDDLARQLAAGRADHAVISTETLSLPAVRPAHVERLVGTIRAAGYEPVVVVVVRPQPELLNSTYAQLVRTLHDPGPVARFLKSALAGPRYDYPARLAPWTDHPGLRFVALPYGGEAARIAERLLTAGGIPADAIARADLPEADQRNASIGPEAVAAFRTLIVRRPELLSAHRVHPVVVEAAKRRGWLDTPFRGLTPDDVERVLARYAATNEAFAERHWGRGWDAVFPARRPPQPANEIDDATLSPERVAAYAAFIDEVAEDLSRREKRRAAAGTRDRGLLARLTGFFTRRPG